MPRRRALTSEQLADLYALPESLVEMQKKLTEHVYEALGDLAGSHPVLAEVVHRSRVRCGGLAGDDDEVGVVNGVGHAGMEPGVLPEPTQPA